MIPFTKAQACGNDFLIVAEDAAREADAVEHWPELTRRLCARSTGIGADGIEFFRWTGPTSGRVRLHNADGSYAEISGNGTRCVAAWMAHALDSRPGDALEISTDAGLRVCHVNAICTSGAYTVDITAGMGIPIFAPRTVVLANSFAIPGVDVSMGNPHFVILADNPGFTIRGCDWQTLGAEICVHQNFPHQTNVLFFRIVSPAEIEIRIFERGVGPTTSSGTGSCASATAAIALQGCHSPLTVVAPGGAQTVTWDHPGAELHLTGPAALIARGEAY